MWTLLSVLLQKVTEFPAGIDGLSSAPEDSPRLYRLRTPRIIRPPRTAITAATESPPGNQPPSKNLRDLTTHRRRRYYPHYAAAYYTPPLPRLGKPSGEEG